MNQFVYFCIFCNLHGCERPVILTTVNESDDACAAQLKQDSHRLVSLVDLFW